MFSLLRKLGARYTFVALIAGLALLLAGCSSDTGDQASQGQQPIDTPAEAPNSDPTTDGNPDGPIDMNALLTKNGFTGKFSNIETDAAYMLVPFASPAELELDDAETTTCMFSMVRVDYESGPVAQYAFSTHNHMARLTAHQVNPDGSIGAALPQAVEMDIRELTPESLKEAFADSLSQCGDTELR